MQRRDFQNLLVFSGVFRAYVYGGDARVHGELHVRETVAHHHGVGKVNIGEVGLGLQRHPDFGLSATAVLAGKVRTAIDSIQRGHILLKSNAHPTVNLVDVLHLADAPLHTLLVGHNDDVLELRTQPLHGGEHAVDEDELLRLAHVSAYDLHVDDAVTV